MSKSKLQLERALKHRQSDLREVWKNQWARAYGVYDGDNHYVKAAY